MRRYLIANVPTFQRAGFVTCDSIRLALVFCLTVDIICGGSHAPCCKQVRICERIYDPCSFPRIRGIGLFGNDRFIGPVRCGACGRIDKIGLHRNIVESLVKNFIRRRGVFGFGAECNHGREVRFPVCSFDRNGTLASLEAVISDGLHAEIVGRCRFQLAE